MAITVPTNGVGTSAAGTGDITPALPTGYAQNDILVLLAETYNQAISVSGWTQATDSPQSNADVSRLHVWWKRAGASETAPTITDPGDHCIAQIIAFRGCTTSGDPWADTSGSVNDTAGTSVSIPGVTTTAANQMVVAVVGITRNGTSTANFSSWANANLESCDERMDVTNTAGLGGGFGMATGIKASAGATGNTTCTDATSQRHSYWCGCLIVGSSVQTLTVTATAAVVPTTKKTTKRAFAVAASSVATVLKKTKRTLVLSGSESLQDHYDENFTGDYVPLVNASGISAIVAQAFTPTGGKLSRARFYLGYTGTPTNNVRANLYAHSGTFGSGTPGSLLKSSGWIAAPSTGGNQWVEFSFDGTYELSADHYFIAIETDGTNQSNYPRVNHDNTVCTHSGNQKRYVNSAWIDPPANRDTWFEVYARPSGVSAVASVTTRKLKALIVTATASVVASVSRKAKVTRQATVSVVASVVKKTKQHALSASATVVPMLVRRARKVVKATVSAVATVTTQKLSGLKYQTVQATASVVASVKRNTKATRKATASAAVSVSKKTVRTVVATVASVASMTWQKISGVMPSVQIRVFAHRSVTTSVVAQLVDAVKHAGSQVKYQTVQATAAVVTSVSRRAKATRTATSAVVTSVRRKAKRTFSVSASAAASVTKKTRRTLLAAASAIASQTSHKVAGYYQLTVQATASAVASVKRKAKPVRKATAAVVASVTRQVDLHRVLTASASVAASVSKRTRQHVLKATASVVPTLTRRARKVVQATSNAVVAVKRKTMKVLSVTVSAIATVTIEATVTVWRWAQGLMGMRVHDGVQGTRPADGTGGTRTADSMVDTRGANGETDGDVRRL